MPKYLSAMIIAVVTLSFVVTYAEENTATPFQRIKPAFPQWSEERKENTDATREELKQKHYAWRAEVAAKREAFKNSTREDKARFWNGAKRMLGERFAAAVTNLERAQTRIAELIDRLEEDGKDVTEAETLLAASKEKLEDAKDKLEEIKALIPQTGEETTPELFEQIKTKAREAKDLLKEAHQALVETIVELRGSLN